jgi:predicted ArsR family transcriptional regulator
MHAMIPTSKASRCMAVLADGPATSGEVSIETGLTPHDAATHLRNLFLRGKVVREPFKKTGGRGRRDVWLWRLP